jgi:hypothetical protein
MTLLEVLVALVMLATVFTILIQVQRSSVAKAANARSQSIAARLGEQMIHRIEAGMVPDLQDGYEGDFSEDGFGNFSFLIGIGDGSEFAGGALDETEEVLRRFRQQADDENEDEVLPEKTRIYLTISFPSYLSETRDTFQIETLVDSWAIEQDFALFEQLWPDLLPTAIE